MPEKDQSVVIEDNSKSTEFLGKRKRVSKKDESEESACECFDVPLKWISVLKAFDRKRNSNRVAFAPLEIMNFLEFTSRGE